MVKHGEGTTYIPELSLLKFLSLAYHHSHSLDTTLDFTSFFTAALLGSAHFFYSCAVFDWIDLTGAYSIISFDVECMGSPDDILQTSIPKKLEFSTGIGTIASQ